MDSSVLFPWFGVAFDWLQELWLRRDEPMRTSSVDRDEPVVPDVIGLPLIDARVVLARRGLTWSSDVADASHRVKELVVMGQDPGAGTWVDPGSAVVLELAPSPGTG
jgi:PASTA domain